MKKLTIILLSLLLLTNTSYSQDNLLKSGNNLIKVGNNLIGIPFNQYSMLLDGVDEQIGFGDISELDGVTNFTITGWAKQPVLDVESGIWQKWLDTDNRITMVTWSDGKMYVEFGTTNGNFDYSTVISANQWFSYAVVYNGGGAANSDRLKIYINAANQTLTFPGTIPSTSGDNVAEPFRLGVYNVDAQRKYWKDNLDETAIWSNSFTQSEITEFHNKGKPTNLLKHSASSSLVEWWRMGDGATWDGSNWTIPGKKENYSGTSINIEFSDKVTDVP